MWNTWNDAWQPWLFPMAAAPAAARTPAYPWLGASDRAPAAPLAGFFERAYLNQCGARRYKLFIPSGHARRGLPLVVMLHGCGQSVDDFAMATRMNELAEEEQCFVLYPEQSSSANCARCWNWFQANDQQRDQGEPGIIAGMAEEVIAEFAIDSARVFVAGLSAGGAMAVIMGQPYPDLFRAVGCHSGLPFAAASDASSAMNAMRHGVSHAAGAATATGSARRSVPVIVFQGDCDTTVHPSNGAGIVAQSLAQSLAPDGAFEARAADVYQGHTTGRDYTRTVHLGADGQPAAEQWIIHGTGHAWSGGSHRGTYAESRGPDAATEMLRFFLSTAPEAPQASAAPYRQLQAAARAPFGRRSGAARAAAMR